VKRRGMLFSYVVVFVVLATVLALLVRHTTVAVLQPRGYIADKERSLLFLVTGLGLLIIVPVFIMTFTIAWRYREGNTKATYRPDWDGDRRAETIWWTVPLILIAIVSVITWNSSHELDPFKPLASSNKPITIQVVALQWKWLFIYPQQDIATVNYLQFPERTPVNFELTADAPMNSFWIPQLGGQIYAMTGMSTQLHLMADGQGSYRGSSANISGTGFASMHFVAKSSSLAAFKQWVNQVKQSPQQLDTATYHQLAQPSIPKQQLAYSADAVGLYDKIILGYMLPPSQVSALYSGSQIEQVYNSMRSEY
jgi:cytochrome o ubiquinol oxidase subunit 2